MIPSTNTILTPELEVEKLESKSYKMILEHNIINGKCEGTEAMKQVIYKILNTERYENLIYSWNYGIELKDLYGEPVTYVCAELKRRITEALIQDDRVEDVTNFKFDTSKRKSVIANFTVHTIFGAIDAERMVSF